jgi:hypothetical protein
LRRRPHGRKRTRALLTHIFYMQTPIGPRVPAVKLVPGRRYYAFPLRRFSRHCGENFRGTFTEFFVNEPGYNMIRFHNVRYTESGHEVTSATGLYLRIFEPNFECGDPYAFYEVSRFSDTQKKELDARFILRERRQYERGLTGTRPDGAWFPRDVVRELSLRYLTDQKVNCVKRWKIRPSASSRDTLHAGMSATRSVPTR